MPSGWFDPVALFELPPEEFDPPQQVIACARCTAQAIVRGFPLSLVNEQMRLYREGWRRDPNSQVDYCPRCAPASDRGRDE